MRKNNKIKAVLKNNNIQKTEIFEKVKAQLYKPRVIGEKIKMSQLLIKQAYW